MMIQNAYAIADLPQSISSDGKTLASDVLSVVRSNKRKRSEIALAVDGQGLNIYDV